MDNNFYLKIMKYAVLDFVLLRSFFMSLALCWSLRKVRFQSRYYYLEVHGSFRLLARVISRDNNRKFFNRGWCLSFYATYQLKKSKQVGFTKLFSFEFGYFCYYTNNFHFLFLVTV